MRTIFSLVTISVCLIAQTASAKIVHRWSFEKDATDSVGSVSGRLQDGAAAKDGKVTLDGQNNWVELPIGGTLAKLKSTTLEAWVTWDEMQGAWCRVFDFGMGQQANMFFTPRNGNPPDAPTTNKPRFAITNMGFAEEEQLHGKDAFPVGKLTHVVITIDADKKVGKLYINAKEEDSQEMTLTPSSVGNTTNNYLGASEYDADPMFKGSITEFRVYDTALTADEVTASGKAGPDQLAGATTAAAPAQAAMAPKAGDTGKSSTPATAGDAGKSSTPAVAGDAAKTPMPASGGLVHRWTFATDASDSVGKANGTLEEGAKVEGGRVVLDGQRAHVALPIGGTIEQLKNASFETWVTWDERQRAWSRLFDFGARRGKSMYITPRNGGGRQGGPTNTLRFTITVNNDPGEQQANSPDQFPVGAETHVVLAVDADKKMAKLYVNGKLAATREELTLTPSDLGNTVNNWIGRSQFPDPFFKGSFNEFRIYNKALSPEEIEASFKAGPDKVGQ